MLAMTRNALAALLVAAAATSASAQSLPPEARPDFDLAPRPDPAPDLLDPEGGTGFDAVPLPEDGEDVAGDETEPKSREERLDDLFARLADPEVGDAEIALRGISRLWSMSGSDSMDLLLRRGREAMREEAYAKAVEHFANLTRLDPDFAEGWNALATANFLRDEYWLAVEYIQATLALEPRHFGALSGLGVILERTGDEAGALAAFRAALEINPHLDQAAQAVERLAPKVDGRDI